MSANLLHTIIDGIVMVAVLCLCWVARKNLKNASKRTLQPKDNNPEEIPVEGSRAMRRLGPLPSLPELPPLPSLPELPTLPSLRMSRTRRFVQMSTSTLVPHIPVRCAICNATFLSSNPTVRYCANCEEGNQQQRPQSVQRRAEVKQSNPEPEQTRDLASILDDDL